MSWEPTPEFRYRKVMVPLLESTGEVWNGDYWLQQKWVKAVPPEHDGATGYFQEDWRDVPVVDE